MTEQRHPPLDELDLELRRLGERLEFPPTPDIASAVSARLRAGPVPIQTRARPVRRYLWLAAAALLLIAIAAWALSPGLRETVAGALGLPGIRIEVVPGDPGATSPSGELERLLGPSVSLDQAVRDAGFPLRLPTDQRLGAPTGIHLSVLPSGARMVSVIYPAGVDLPATGADGAGLLLMQFPADQSSDGLLKQVAMTGEIAEARVNGIFAWWITGSSRLMLAPAPGEDDISRPSANILLWEADGVVYRLETALPREDAVAIAESLGASISPEPSDASGGSG